MYTLFFNDFSNDQKLVKTCNVGRIFYNLTINFIYKLNKMTSVH